MIGSGVLVAFAESNMPLADGGLPHNASPAAHPVLGR